MEEQTDRHTDGRADGRTDRMNDGQADIKDRDKQMIEKSQTKTPGIVVDW